MTQPLHLPAPFPVSEFRSRLAALRNVMAEWNVDLLKRKHKQS